MKARYTPSNQTGSMARNTLAAVILTALIFAVLPLIQLVNEIRAEEVTKAPTLVAQDIPDHIVEEPPPEPDEKMKEEPPELEEPPPPITLTQLALLLQNPGTGSDTAVGFNDGFENYISTELPFDFDQLDKKPKALHQIKPLYPYALKQSKVEGSATIEWVINPDGSVRSARVISSSHSEFAKAALDAILKSKWHPGEKDGEIVATRVRQQIYFTL